MILKKEDAQLFYNLYFTVLRNYHESKNRSKSFDDLTIDEISQIRNSLFDNVNYLNTFCELFKNKLPDEHLEIIKKWKFFVKKTFIIYKDLKKYTIFVDTQESLSYGVFGLFKEIRDLINNKFPVMADAVLLPFKNKIVIDGIISPYDFKIKGALSKILINSYRDSKANKGLIVTLPPVIKNRKNNDDEILNYYLAKNKDGKTYTEEILNLIKQNFRLLKKYYDGIVKPNSEIYSIIFKAIGLKKGWFAVLDGIIITSGHSEEEVKNKLAEFLPPDKIELVTIFEINGT